MPNRIIKESICTSDTIDQMSWFDECFFVRLLTACDDYGRMDARPAILKSRLFPLKGRLSLRDVEDALHRLADTGCVVLYQRDGKPYLYLPTWELHQQIRAKKSRYPAPGPACGQLQADDINCARNPILSESETDPPAPHRGARRRFCPPTVEEVEAYCAARGNRVEPQAFVDFYTSNGWRVGKNPMRDWQAAVRGWEQRDPGQRGPGGQQAGPAEQKRRVLE